MLSKDEQVEMVREEGGKWLFQWNEQLYAVTRHWENIAEGIKECYRKDFDKLQAEVTDQEGNKLLLIRHPEQEVSSSKAKSLRNISSYRAYPVAQSDMLSLGYIRVIKE